MTLSQRTKGFTLVELLVVIAIIQLISVVTIVNVNIARKKARDTARVAAVKNLVTAIQSYYITHGYWPRMTQAEANNPNINRYQTCSSVPICDYSSADYRTTCASIKKCTCAAAGGSEKNWFPMIDGTMDTRDKFFEPQSTPLDPMEDRCAFNQAIPHFIRYDGYNDPVNGSSFRLTFLLEIHDPRASWQVSGCEPTVGIGCYYYVQGFPDGSIR